ncbi:MAG: hypothetical protein J6M17_02350 [Ruminococcus sp.]|nr:hypothetical protein [Ruminococcus sp.]
MIALLSAAAVITIAILVKTGIIKYYTRGGGVLVMALTALASGLFGYQVIRSSLALFCEQFGFGEGLLDVFKVESDSAAGSAVKLGLLLFLSLPLVIAEIFIFYSMIKEPIKRVAMHTDMEYESRCAARTAFLGIVASVVMLAAGAGTLIMIIPQLPKLMETLFFFNPLFIIVAGLLTFGLGFIVFPMYALAVNSVLISLLTFGMGAVMTLYVFSAAMSIAAAVRGYRAGKLAKTEAVICGVLSLLMFWNIIPMIYMKKRVN